MPQTKGQLPNFPVTPKKGGKSGAKISGKGGKGGRKHG